MFTLETLELNVTCSLEGGPHSSISPWMKIKRGVKIRRAAAPLYLCALGGTGGEEVSLFTAV